MAAVCSRATLGLLVLVLLVGCTAPAGPGEPTPTGTENADPVTPPTVTDEPNPTDRPWDANETNTVADAELGSEARAAFDDAEGGQARFITDTEYVEGDPFSPDALEPYRTHRYVERNGTYYRIERSTGDLYATYFIDATRTNATVGNATAVGELSMTVRPQVRWAIENGSYSTPLGKWGSLPPALDGVEHVRANGTTYELTVAVGDAWVQRVHLERIGTVG